MLRSITLLVLLCLCGVSAIVRPAGNEEVVGLITIKLISFSNPGHRLATGDTCDSGWFGSRKCDPHFTVCLQQLNNSLLNNLTGIGSNNCDFGGPVTCGPFDNIAEFEFGANWCSRPNPFLLNFTTAWNGLDMGIRVMEMERGSFLGSNTATGPLVDNFSYVFNGKPSADTIFKLKLSGTTKANSSLVVEAQVQCHLNYYDDRCSTYCLPEPNYKCDVATGRPVCKARWSGEDCVVKTLSDNLTIHPLSTLGAQIDGMTVYEVDAPNTTMQSPLVVMDNSTFVVELTPVVTENVNHEHLQEEVVTVQPEEIANAHFDKQSGSKNSSVEPKAVASGVATTMQPSTFSSMWPLTVSLVVGGLSYYASTSPSVTSENTSGQTSKPEVMSAVIENSTVDISVISTTSSMSNTLVSSTFSGRQLDNYTVAPPSDSSTTSTITAVSSSALIPETKLATIMATSTISEEISTSTEDPLELNAVYENERPANVSRTAHFVGQTTKTSITEHEKSTTESLGNNITDLDEEATATASNSISYVPGSSLQNSDRIENVGSGTLQLLASFSAWTSTTQASATASATTTFSNLFPAVETVSFWAPEETNISSLMSSNVSKIGADVTTLTTVSTSTGLPQTSFITTDVDINGTSTETISATQATALFTVETALNLVSTENLTNSKMKESVLVVDAKTSVSPLVTDVSQFLVSPPVAENASLETTKTESTTISSDLGVYITTNVVLHLLNQPHSDEEVSTVSSTSTSDRYAGTIGVPINISPVAVVDNSTSVLSNSSVVVESNFSEVMANETSNLPFWTFHLPSGERFSEPLASLAFLDQLNASVSSAVEEMLVLKNIPRDVLNGGLKTAAEFTGISLNHSMIVPQVTLYVTLNGSSVLKSSEFETVWSSALTNMRSNATVTRNPFATSHLNQNYASQHPIMIFLMALLSVAIVILVGIISVLARKPKLMTRSRQHRASISEDPEILSAFDNFAFSDRRPSVVPDEEIVSLEPSIYSEVHSGQERLFTRRAAAHAAWKSPIPVIRDGTTSSRTTTTFVREPGSTI